MNCICDEFSFPPEVQIVPGLTTIPRQIGTFAEFRRALLRAASIRNTASLENHPLWKQRYLLERDREGVKKTLEAFGLWRGRHPKDFGMMLLEMWAYVCDLVSFYDSVLAHESYLRTAIRRESVRKLVDPLGYIPRPAVAALAELTVQGDGRRTVNLPVGTAFSSGAFPGSPPQVFETSLDTTIHPFFNEWRFLPIRRPTFGPTTVLMRTFLCEVGSVTVKEGDIVLLKIGATRHTATVTKVEAHEGKDHLSYSALSLSSWISIPANTPLSSVKLLKPSIKTQLWNQTIPAFGPASASSTFLRLESITPLIKTGQDLIIERSGLFHPSAVIDAQIVTLTLKAATTTNVTDKNDAIIAKVPVPAITAPTSQVVVQPNVPSVNANASSVAAALGISVHHGFVPAGKITVEALTELDRTDPMAIQLPIDEPDDALPPGRFQLEDVNGNGLTRPGTLNFATGHFNVQGDSWPRHLDTPVKLFGNVVSTSRGETVKPETLGVGDAAIANQSFTLKKSPLTYLPAPSESTPSGLGSTLKIYVDGLRWTEVPSFYGRRPEDEIYIVRQNDKNESTVTFGDGVLGRRLSTGVSVVAYYRFGAGAAMPAAGSITQIAKPVKGLKSVRNPVASYGGADEEPAGSLQKYAPRSALLLGRAVSLPDLDAAAASYSGVKAVAAEWRWSETLQVPAAHIYYLAGGDLTELILNKLRGLTQPDTPIQVERALPTPARLSIEISWNPKRFEVDVLAALRTALTNADNGMLAPEILGIGKTLFRSQLFDAVLSVAGVLSVTGLSYGDLPFSTFGIKAPAGHYFDFTNQLFLNGRNE